MSDTDFNMYDVDTEEDAQATDDKSRVVVNRMPVTTEIKIDDKVVVTVNPEFVTALQRKISWMENKIKTLENDFRLMQSNLRNKDAAIERLKYMSNDDYE